MVGMRILVQHVREGHKQAAIRGLAEKVSHFEQNEFGGHNRAGIVGTAAQGRPMKRIAAVEQRHIIGGVGEAGTHVLGCP